MNPNSPTPTTPLTPAPTVTPHVESYTQAELTPPQAATMAGWIKQDLAQGRISPQQAQKAFDQLGATEAQRAPDTRTAEERQLDAAFPPGKPEDYRITYGGPGEDVPMTPELKQFDQSARTLMASAGMPKNIGDSLVTTIAKVEQATKNMSASELETYGHKEFEKLQRVHGEKLEERLQAAGRMVLDLDTQHRGLKNLLNSRGIGDNAMVANMLIAHAQIYHARKGR